MRKKILKKEDIEKFKDLDGLKAKVASYKKELEEHSKTVGVPAPKKPDPLIYEIATEYDDVEIEEIEYKIPDEVAIELKKKDILKSKVNKKDISVEEKLDILIDLLGFKE